MDLYVVNNLREERIYLANNEDHAIELATKDRFIRVKKNSTYATSGEENHYRPSASQLNFWLRFSTEKQRFFLPGLELEADGERADLLRKIPEAAAKRSLFRLSELKIEGMVTSDLRRDDSGRSVRTPVVGGVALYEINDEYERLYQIEKQMVQLGQLMGWKEAK